MVCAGALDRIRHHKLMCAFRYPCPRPETTYDILKRNLALCPELAPPEIRALRTPTVEDLSPIIIEEGCGFRPARKGGIRLDVDWANLKAGKRKIPIVFNYGYVKPSALSAGLNLNEFGNFRHGGYGYISSWGSASIALDLLESVLEV